MTINLKNLGDVCQNISRSYDFSNRDKVIFINTGDVLNGEILHNNYLLNLHFVTLYRNLFY